MPDQINADHIKALSCELSIHRKGCISVHINLENGILTWRESRQWCNDFTRSISTAYLMELHQYLKTSPLIQQLLKQAVLADPSETICLIACRPRPAADTNSAEANPPVNTMDADIAASDIYHDVDFSKSSWQISFSLDQEHYAYGGNLPFTAGCCQLHGRIENLSRAPFRVM